MNQIPDPPGGDTFETRLLRALTEVDARRPASAAAAAEPVRRPWRMRRRPAVLVVAVLAALLVVGGATAAASLVLRPDRPDKNLPLGTKTILRPGKRTGIKGMGCQPGSVVTVRLDGVRLGSTTAETDTSIPGVVGFFVAQVTIPADTPPGDHVLVASCPMPHGVGNYLKEQRVTITVVRS
jgi:hypothetical protein